MRGDHHALSWLLPQQLHGSSVDRWIGLSDGMSWGMVARPENGRHTHFSHPEEFAREEHVESQSR